MKRWRRRRHVGGSELASLTPAQVRVLRERQDRIGTVMVRLFVAFCFAGALGHVTLFARLGAEEYGGIMLASVGNAIVVATAFFMILGGRELLGAVLALASSILHVLWVCVAVSAGVSVESILFVFAVAPFLLIRKELPALRFALSSFAIAIYLVCELAFPDGAGLHQLEADVAATFARSNRIVAGLGLLLLVAILQRNLSITRRVLEGAARYGELRATTDELTSLYNRRPIIAQLRLWAASGRGNYGIALVDIDRFKAVNDEFGHDCGDTVIQEVAAALRHHFRETDMVSRWGGDEFLILMPGIRHADMVPMLERARRAINLIEVQCQGHVHHVTVSVGASMGATGQTPDECIAAADHALYRAKEQGRDKVVAVGVSFPTQAQGRPSP